MTAGAEALGYDQASDLISYGKSATYAYNGGAATTALQYDGQYTDAESGFQYLQARYYDPATGQFLTLDPLVSLTGEPWPPKP